MHAQYRLVHAINEPKQWNSLITHSSSVLLMCGWWGSFVSSLNANAILMIKTIVYCLSKQKQNENRNNHHRLQIYMPTKYLFSLNSNDSFVHWKRCDLKPISISIGFQIICFFSSQSRTKCGMFQVNQHNMKWCALNTTGRPEQFWFNSEKPTTYDHLKLGSLSCVKQTSFLLLLVITLE